MVDKALVSKIKKQKKKWFIVKSPEIYGAKEIGEIPAFEPNELLGRTLELSFRELTGSPKETINKVVLKITKVQGETATTEPVRFFVSESYIQTIGRRSKDKIEVISKPKTKDGKKVKVKVLLINKSKVVRSVNAGLTHATEKEVADFVGKANFVELFSVMANKNLSAILKKELKKIYPTQPFVWKIELL